MVSILKEMYRLALVTIFTSFFLSLHSQESFFKRYPNLEDLANEAVQSINSIDDDHVYLYSTGACSSDDPYNWDMITRKVNTLNGELIWKKYNRIPNSGITPTCSFTNPNNNNIIITGLLTSNENNSTIKEGFAYLCEQDTTGEILWEGIYGEDVRTWSKGASQLSNGDYVLVGWQFIPEVTTTNRQETFILKTNNVGDSLWMQTVRSSPDAIEMEGVGVVVDDSDNIYALSDEQMNLSLKQMAVSKYTATGDSLWTKYYPINEASFAKDIVRSENENFVISGYAGFTDNNYIAPFLMEIDTGGNVIWLKDYLDEVGGFAEKITHTNDGGYATCLDRNGVTLLVTDILGEVEFVKSYDFGVRSPKDLVQLNDGSFIMTGYIGHPPNDDNFDTIWLIKTDPKGNVTSTTGVEVNESLINVFPNPTTDYVEVQIPSNALKYNIRLVNNSGLILKEVNAVDKQIFMDLSSYSSGFYYLNIFEQDKLIATKKIVKK